jgi:hypothetical protein|tara:strand:- start:37 stop:171 length:135 start_codon:yes stop_codon:yes gene_type:complete
MEKMNKYKLKSNYVGSLNSFIERLDDYEQKIVKQNGDNSNGKKD